MNRVVKGVIFAVPPILVLVILPHYLLRLVPSSVENESESVLGFSIPGFVDDLAVFGILLAALSFLQSWAYNWSVVKPVASALHMLTSYTLLLFLLGFGNPLTFGTSNIGINPSSFSGRPSGVGTITIQLISTFIALMVGIAVAAKTAQKTLKFREDGQLHRLGLEGAARQGAAPGAVQGQARQQAPSAVAVICPNCGKPVESGTFCTNCGARLASA
jgi:hypothetical protein